MTVVADASFVVALLLRNDAHHARAAAWYETADDELVSTPLVLAELDIVLMRRGGPVAREALRDDLRSGAIRVRWWADALTETLDIAGRFPSAGIADASLLALARLERTSRIATFDEDFRSMTLPDGGGLTLIPHDET